MYIFLTLRDYKWVQSYKVCKVGSGKWEVGVRKCSPPYYALRSMAGGSKSFNPTQTLSEGEGLKIMY